MMDNVPFSTLEDRALERAENNIEKWGYQPLPILLLALHEEFGELTKAYLEFMYENGSYAELYKELMDCWALIYQIQHIIQLGERDSIVLKQEGYEQMK